jgi:hypothetical protein
VRFAQVLAHGHDAAHRDGSPYQSPNVGGRRSATSLPKTNATAIDRRYKLFGFLFGVVFVGDAVFGEFVAEGADADA